MLNGIDISSWQTGIDLSVVPCDFVVIKATGGIGYVNPDCDRAYQQAKAQGKKLGFYHYAREKGYKGSAADEARFFIDSCRNYVGEAIPVLDWEEELSAGVSWAKEFLDAVYAETGVKPLLYASKSVLREYDWSSVANAGYGLWFAQYANYNATGYQDSPWTDNGGIGAWPFPAMFQYSSAGSLPGWNGSLDLNIFFGDESAWDAYASAGSGSTEPNAEPVKSVDDIAHEVIAGAWGNGDERRARLAAAGYDFDTVQGRVNDLLGANRQRIYTVVAGDTLSGIGAKLGVDWRSIASSNGISSPYTIYPGDQLTY